jgi:hypothetical protein
LDGPALGLVLGLAVAVGRAAGLCWVAAWCRTAALGFADDFGDGDRRVSADAL